VGCGEKSAPTVSDVNNIVVDGKKLSPVEFLNAYCVSANGKESKINTDENCSKVEKKRVLDTTQIKKVQW